MRKTQGKKGFYLDESLTVLVERGYIRIENIQTGRRPIEQIFINPETQNIVTKLTK
jgi:cytochrome oxidase assembly protein ShyY1